MSLWSENWFILQQREFVVLSSAWTDNYTDYNILMEPIDNGWLISWLLFIKHEWTPPPSSSSSKVGTQPSRFTLPSLRAADGSGSAVYSGKNTESSFSTLLLRLWTHFPRHIVPLCAKTLYERGQQTEWNRKRLCLCTSSAQKQMLAQHKHPKICLFVVIQKYQFKSYLWFFLHRWPGMRFCPSNRAGEHRTCRTLTSCRGTRVLFFWKGEVQFWKPEIDLTLLSWASEGSERL